MGLGGKVVGNSGKYSTVHDGSELLARSALSRINMMMMAFVDPLYSQVTKEFLDSDRFLNRKGMKGRALATDLGMVDWTPCSLS